LKTIEKIEKKSKIFSKRWTPIYSIKSNKKLSIIYKWTIKYEKNIKFRNIKIFKELNI